MAAIVPLMMVLVFDPDSAADLKTLRGDPWNQFYAQARVPLSIVFLPLFILLLCTLLPQIEYRNNTWKQVLTSPQPLGYIFFAKFLIVQLLILVFLLAYALLMGISGFVVNALYPAFEFQQYSLDGQKLLIILGQTYISVLALSALLFWLGMRFKSFIIPIASGIILWFATTLLLFEFHWNYITNFPFAFPLLLPFPSYASLVTFILGSSLAYAVVFLVLGFIDFSRRKVKE